MYDTPRYSAGVSLAEETFKVFIPAAGGPGNWANCQSIRAKDAPSAARKRLDGLTGKSTAKAGSVLVVGLYTATLFNIKHQDAYTLEVVK